MDYLALYRKYRPTSFEDMVGQEDIKVILTSSVMNNQISHAYLFSGPRGTGKTSTAKIFSKMVNCENINNGIPCGKCKSCLSFNDNSDIVEIDAASNNGVDEIRDLREKATLVPSICKYKVYIIDEVHMLTTQAFNALLKILEEPPKHVIFILATTEYHKVPLTITSRCQKFQFNKLTVNENFNKLKEISKNENISVTDDALLEIAKISDGGMRDSINFLDQLRSFKKDKIELDDVFEVCGSVSSTDICELLVNLKDNKPLNISKYLEEIGNKGKSYSKFLEDVLFILKDCILLKNDVSYQNIKCDVNILKSIVDRYSLDDIYYVIDSIDKLIEKLKFSSRQSILIVTSFLLIMNKFNSNSSEIVAVDSNKIDNLNFEKNENLSNVNNNDANLQLTNDSVIDNKIIYDDNFYYINKDIIINNALATANKELKINLQKYFKSIDDYLMSTSFKYIASLFRDCKIEVVGDKYIIFSSLQDSIIDNIYSKYEDSEKFIKDIFHDLYYFSVVTEEEWQKLKEEYISMSKKGSKFILKDLINYKNNCKKEELKDTSFVDKLIDIVGDDIVEIK